MYPSTTNKESKMQTIDRSKTQVKTTAGTYRKVRDFIMGQNINARVLDFGAGLCEGTDILMEGCMAESFEPFAKEGVFPTHTSLDTIKGKFDFVVSNCVLNVVEDIAERTWLVTQMLNRLTKGGQAIIMVRSHSAVKANKTNKPFADGFVNAKGTFQRGFTTEELIDLVVEASKDSHEDFNGAVRFEFAIDITKLGDVGVLVRRVA
jgi:hypothetical protein